jgi:hypothetical protein
MSKLSSFTSFEWHNSGEEREVCPNRANVTLGLQRGQSQTVSLLHADLTMVLSDFTANCPLLVRSCKQDLKGQVRFGQNPK